ncbi:MAG: T9SS type A sorting domain-containing protein [Saprospiraceae bacterium]|jgi:hypothetical protein|nr:T9SS type A sorting domain-containing protein [Saprospiraceae bacterium]
MTAPVSARILLCSLFVMLLAAPAAYAQVFWTEDFADESTATSNWQHDGNNAGPSFWTWTDDPATGFQDPDLPVFAAPTASNGYFLFNSEANGQTPHDVWLTNVNRPADCSGKTGVKLRFYTQYIYFNPAGTLAQIGVSTDGADFTWQNLFSNLPANMPFQDSVEIDLNEADNQPQVWLRFRWIGNYEYHWKIDDLALLTPDTTNPDFCETAVDLTQYLGHTPDSVQTTGIFDNTSATVSVTDPEVACWGEVGPGGLDILNNTLWFTFVGDGGSYDIQTVPCNAANYIGSAQGNLGDTQMLAFAGDSCTDLTEIVCNDDLFNFGIPDWRAGISLETTPGQRYYLLIDGFESQGIAATGEFCIQIAQQAVIPCSEGQVGSFDVANNGFLCVGENVANILSADVAEYVLPTVGPEHGLTWCISPAPLTAGTWPGSIPGIFSAPFAPDVAPPDLPNDNSVIPYGSYYLTPVVLGGGTRINAGVQPFIFNIDPTGGCFFIGQSVPLVLLPPLNPLSASTQVVNEVLPPGNNGAILLQTGGGSGQYLGDMSQYLYQWNTGATTKDLSGLTSGTYTVTISDRSGCTGTIFLTVMVGQTVSTGDPESVQTFDIRPNPANAVARLSLELKAPAEVRMEVVNALGQVVETLDLGKSDRFVQELHLGQFPEGTYVVRIFAGNMLAQRRLVLAR